MRHRHAIRPRIVRRQQRLFYVRRQPRLLATHQRRNARKCVQSANERIAQVSDKLAEGQVVRVKVLEIDRQGRIRLSMKEVEIDVQPKSEETSTEDSSQAQNHQ